MNVVATFPTPAAFFEALRGPSPHDEHVRAFRHELWLRDKEIESKAAYDRVQAELKLILAEMRSPTSAACAEVRAYMAKPKRLRTVAA